MATGKIQYGILHNHTEFSVRDSAMKIPKLFERAKELGAPAVALTDHGILTGVIDFVKAGQEYGIKAIPGIEAYYVPDGAALAEGVKTKPQHLILMAKDIQGYKAICKAVHQSYQFVSSDHPCMDEGILRKAFGGGTAGHGHVIATSACVGGVLASILLEDNELLKAVSKLERQRDKYHPIDDEVNDAVYEEERMAKEIAELIEKRDKLTEDSKINVTGLRRRLKTLKPDDPDYALVSAQLDEQLLRKQRLADELEATKKELAAKKKAKSAYSKRIEPLKNSAARWAEINGKIEETLKQGKGESFLYDKAKSACRMFADVFGEGNFFVEIQYHHIEREKYVMPKLVRIARELGVPLVAANDAHYATRSYEDVRAHSLVAAMRFANRTVDDIEAEPGFDENYIRDDEELVNVLSEIVDRADAEDALRNIGVIVSACDVRFEKSKHYPVFPCEGETAAERLSRLAAEGIAKRYPGSKWTPAHQRRLDYELNVIQSMGYSDYLCIVQDFLDYGRKLGRDCPEGVGYSVGPGRGSAVGSIVCYLTGITNVDPMRYNLIFERFLNPERVSMPDIDSDFSQEVRERVVDYVRDKYRKPGAGDDAEPICSIITEGTMKAKAAIRNVGRVTNVPLPLVDEIARKVPDDVKATLKDALPNLETMCDENPVVKRLIDDAMLVEGTTINYGVHAAGVIIADNGDVGEYVPLYRNITRNEATGPWVAQLDMRQCEGDAGLLKMDFLGLNNLDVISDTLRRIKRNYKHAVDIENLPEEAEIFENIFSNGNTDGVFQFESSGMRDMLRQFRPANMEDLVLLAAAYRPGPMQFLPDIIKVKQGRQKPHYIVPELEGILSSTYGSAVYQEQIMQVFHEIGGLSMGESDIVRKAISKKKLDILLDTRTNYKGRLIDGFISKGASPEDAEAFWDSILDFADYAFNESHAAAYAMIAYQTAYLKYHYPAEYMCALMSHTTYEKMPAFIAVCRKMGLTVLPPDINRSMDDFTSDELTIRYGLGNIKGIGKADTVIIAEREKNGLFLSVKDFVNRMLSGDNADSYNSRVVESLISAGAFDEFCEGNRASLLCSIDAYADAVKLRAKKQALFDQRLAQFNKLQEEDADEKALKQAYRLMKNAEEGLASADRYCSEHCFTTQNEDEQEKLGREYELLGAYLSGNPFDAYSESVKAILNRTPIANAMTMRERSRVTICGVVKGLDIRQRSKDGKPYALFTVCDDTGDIDVKCFVSKYELYGDVIKDGAALKIEGYISSDKRADDSGDAVETNVYVSVDEIEALKRNRNELIIVFARSPVDWKDNYEAIKAYEASDGYELVYEDDVDVVIRKTGLYVTKDILTADMPGMQFRLSCTQK